MRDSCFTLLMLVVVVVASVLCLFLFFLLVRCLLTIILLRFVTDSQCYAFAFLTNNSNCIISTGMMMMMMKFDDHRLMAHYSLTHSTKCFGIISPVLHIHARIHRQNGRNSANKLVSYTWMW